MDNKNNKNTKSSNSKNSNKSSKKIENTIDLISRLTNKPKQVVLDEAIEFFARKHFFEQANKEFENLSKKTKK